MSKKRVRTCCLVIDASIAKAAGPFESRDPVGMLCRDFLMAVRKVCHRMAWSEAIRVEWNRRQGRFATDWRVSMTKLITKVRTIEGEALEALRTAIEEHSKDQNVVAKMLKDVHLIEAALATDSRIASLDESVREHFSRLAATFGPLRPILWVNPVTEGERAIEWLEAGAPARRSRRLKR